MLKGLSKSIDKITMRQTFLKELLLILLFTKNINSIDLKRLVKWIYKI